MESTSSAAPRRPSVLPTILLLAVAGFLVWRTWLRPAPPLHDTEAKPRAVAPRGDLAASEKATIELFEKASPSVVHIQNVALLRNRWTLDLTAIRQGEGTGFLWNDRGYVVTNFHVVEGGARFQVILADGKTLAGRLVGTAPDKDLAVLKLDGLDSERYPGLAIGTSQDLHVGQTVLVIGNPFGLDQTLTTGVISGLGREIRSRTDRLIQNVIQTDAAINPGNSGGPLLDSAGRVIGITTAIVSPSGAYAGVGFAIPVDTVNRIVPMLIRGEKPERPGLGVRLLPEHVVRGVEGVVLLDVERGSGAEKAGLRPTRRDPRTSRIILGDIIVALDGKPVRTRLDLYDLLDQREVGDEVTLTIRRGSETEDVKVKLEGVSPR
ncbi:MAG: S1C family serine protease [Planctomycetota bacterium]